MEKIEYLHLIKQSKNISSEMGWYFRELKYHIPKKVCDIDIISNDWIDFTCSHFDLAQHKIEQPREHYDKEANWLATCNQIMGRNSGNTQELNFGLNSNTNDLLCDMLGNDNIKKMGLQREGLLLRLIVNTPGHGIAWHEDGASSYRKKFPHLVGDIKRLWFPVIDWEDGHVFQIGSEVLSKWKSGNVWHIPWGVPHGSSNFGYTIKYTVSVTGVLNG
jgi:hypothetical protein